MNLNLLEAKMKEYEDSHSDLANYLGITPQALSNKKNGNSDFKRKEMEMIKIRYNLTRDDMDLIFFEKKVS